MGLKLQDLIGTARSILNDEGAVTYTDADLLRYANDALDTICDMAPSYFYERGDVPCAPGEVAQALNFTDARALVSVDRIKNGNALTRVEKAALDTFSPDWPAMVPAPAIHWMNHADSPVRFYIYPPAPAGQVLEVTYVRNPSEYAAGDDTGLPTTLSAAVTDYVVGMAMARDDEHVLSQRAQAFMASFAARIKGA